MTKTRPTQCCECGAEANKLIRSKKLDGFFCTTCYELVITSSEIASVTASKIFHRVKWKSIERGWPAPDFDSKFILEKILNGKCEVTGIKFDFGKRNKGAFQHARNPWVPSLDRIDSSKPYTKDNVQMVIYMYNACKSKFSHEDVVKFCKQMAKVS